MPRLTAADKQPIRHRCRCGHTWTALGAAHCSSCHRTFSAVGLFDKHRSAVGDHGRCHNPAEILHNRTQEQLMHFRDDMWRGPEMTDQQKQAIYGDAA